MKHIFNKEELKYKFRNDIYNKLIDIISKFVLKIYPDYSIKKDTLETSIINEKGKVVMNLYYHDPYLFIQEDDYIRDIVSYIQHNFYKNDYDNTNFQDRIIISDIDYPFDDCSIKYEDLDKIEFSKKEYEEWLDSNKFGL